VISRTDPLKEIAAQIKLKGSRLWKNGIKARFNLKNCFNPSLRGTKQSHVLVLSLDNIFGLAALIPIKELLLNNLNPFRVNLFLRFDL